VKQVNGFKWDFCEVVWLFRSGPQKTPLMSKIKGVSSLYPNRFLISLTTEIKAAKAQTPNKWYD